MAVTIPGYITPTCVLGNEQPDGNGDMRFDVFGMFYNGKISGVQNTLSVYYRYRTSGGSYCNWIKIQNPTINDNNTYYANVYITGLDIETQYVFQAYAEDQVSDPILSTEKPIRARPVFDWSEYDFAFNVPVYDETDRVICNGKVSNIYGESPDPNLVLEELILTNNTNVPKSKNWFFIKNMFDGEATNPSSRAQIAIPSGADNCMYYRSHSSDKGWLSWRSSPQINLLYDTINSTFLAQTLSLNLTDYDFIIIESKHGSTFCKVGKATLMYSRSFGTNNTDAYYPCSRVVTVSESGISFGDAVQHSDCPGTGHTIANYLCVPRFIYGVKGVNPK